jgi:hypothetical protein
MSNVLSKEYRMENPLSQTQYVYVMDVDDDTQLVFKKKADVLAHIHKLDKNTLDTQKKIVYKFF